MLSLRVMLLAMKRRVTPSYLRFLIAAIVMLVLIDLVLLDGKRPYWRFAEPLDVAEEPIDEKAAPAYLAQEDEIAPLFPATGDEPDPLWRDLDRWHDSLPMPQIPDREAHKTPAPEKPLWRKNAVPYTPQDNAAKIVIVIDDLGLARRYSYEVIALEAPLTLAFLPYAEGLDEMVETGRAHGHEVIIHMPMEPLNPYIDAGDIVLRSDQPPDVFDAMLQKGLDSITDYVGMNNHMGSKLTQDEAAMDRLMQVLKSQGMLFLDSRTIHTSVAAERAAAHGVPYAVRDVFLDHIASVEAVEIQLAQLERVAAENGYAIAIGHPKPETIAALQAWLPTLAAKNMQLVPLSAVVRQDGEAHP